MLCWSGYAAACYFNKVFNRQVTLAEGGGGCRLSSCTQQGGAQGRLGRGPPGSAGAAAAANMTVNVTMSQCALPQRLSTRLHWILTADAWVGL